MGRVPVDQDLVSRPPDLYLALRKRVVPEPWHIVGASGEPTLAPDSTTIRTGYADQNVTVRFMKDHDGQVHLQQVRMYRAPAPASIYTLFFLPTGYRPDYVQTFVRCGEYVPSVTVNTDGKVQVNPGTGLYLVEFEQLFWYQA